MNSNGNILPQPAFFTFCLPGTLAGDDSDRNKTKRPKNEYAKGWRQHEAAVTTIYVIIATETGLSASNFTACTGDLAYTLGQLDQVAIGRVFGENFNQLP